MRAEPLCEMEGANLLTPCFHSHKTVSRPSSLQTVRENKCILLCTTRFVVTDTQPQETSVHLYQVVRWVGLGESGGKATLNGVSASQRPEGRAVWWGASPCKGPGAVAVHQRSRCGAEGPREEGWFKTCPGTLCCASPGDHTPPARTWVSLMSSSINR